MSRLFSKILPSMGVLALMTAGPAFAQNAPANRASEDVAAEDEIVVTGTQIRGVAPVGGQVVTMDAEAITATGATTTAMVLAHIPQISDFNVAAAPSTGNNFQLAVNRPGLRSLGGATASTSATLILMDGHRLPGSGVLQTFPDPDVVPPAIIQRVEVVPDGGSSIYGSDAVAGVINFITRSDFDGFQVDARHGFGNGFSMDDGSATFGKDWGDGSAFISYSYAHRDPIAAADRDYVRDIDWLTGLGTETRCATPNVTILAVTTALGGGPAARCDRAREQDLFSEDTRHSVLVGFTQDLNADVNFRLKTWYTDRQVESNGGPLRVAGITVAAASPFSIDPLNNQSVQFSFAPVSPTTLQTNHLETWGFSPELTWDFGNDWQMRAMLNYGFSRTNTHNPVVTVADVQAAVTAGTVNPYNIAAPALLANVNTLMNRREVRGFGEDEILNARAVFDGPVFALPGGEVRLALGAETFTENFRTFSDGTNNFLVGASFRASKATRDVGAVFGELNIPIIGDSNEVPGIHSLDLSLSVRSDHYSDFGTVNTQRYGFTYQPVDWITVSGHWGDTFQAPGLADLARSGNIFIALPFIPNAVLVAPADATAVATNGGTSSYNFLGVQGTNPGLLPQQADTWSAGFDVTPPILDSNLSFGATYWNIDYSGRIGSALSFVGQPSVFIDFASELQHDPAGLSYAAAIARFPGAATLLNGLQANGKKLYAVYDFRNTNTGRDVREGVDFRIRYEADVPFGTVFGAVNGSQLLNFQVSPGPTASLRPDQTGFDDNIERRVQTTLGATVGEHFLGQVSWNHSDGTNLATPLGGATAGTGDDQSSIAAFDTVDLYFQYEMLGTGMGENLTFNFGVTNVADEDPPVLKRANGQSAGFPAVTRSTLGRVFQVGVSKRF